MPRLPMARQNFLKLPGCSGIVTASNASRRSPISARSDTCRKRSKLTFAPLFMATRLLPLIPVCSTYFFMPAIASAPAGSTTARQSLKISFIAAQISSVFTSKTSSTCCRAIRYGSLPACRTATPSAKIPTCFRVTRRPRFSASYMQGASSGSTPITLIPGRRDFTTAAMPAINPPPPTGTKIASISSSCCCRISSPTVPCPAITSGSS